MAYETIIDTFWVLLAAILVFFMNLGFAAYDSWAAHWQICQGWNPSCHSLTQYVAGGDGSVCPLARLVWV